MLNINDHLFIYLFLLLLQICKHCSLGLLAFDVYWLDMNWIDC